MTPTDITLAAFQDQAAIKEMGTIIAEALIADINKESPLRRLFRLAEEGRKAEAQRNRVFNFMQEAHDAV